LLRLDNSTFITAIALDASTVPGNSIAPGHSPRSSSPQVSTAAAASRTRSSPSRLLSHAANAETTPKQITGVAASSDTVAVESPSWDWSSG